MTTTIYNEYLLNFLQCYASLAYKYSNKLRRGIWCVEDQEKLIELNLLIKKFSSFDTSEFDEDFPEEQDIYTEAEFLELINQIETLFG